MSKLAENLERTAEAPTRIWAESVEGKWRNGSWSSKPAPDKFPDEREFMLASAHDAELKAAMDTHAALAAELGKVAAQRDSLKAAAEDAEYWLVEHDAGPATVLEELQSAIAACEGGQDV